MERQIAEHDRKKERMAQAQAQQGSVQPRYTDLTAAPKRKASPAPQPVQKPPADVVVPPDVTVRQLAQLLGRLCS